VVFALLDLGICAELLPHPDRPVEGDFSLLDDRLLSVRLPVFAPRQKGDGRPFKFYFFDAGVYRALRLQHRSTSATLEAWIAYGGSVRR
jgi:hypothetical protein